jgi:hypothetical protein
MALHLEVGNALDDRGARVVDAVEHRLGNVSKEFLWCILSSADPAVPATSQTHLELYHRGSGMDSEELSSACCISIPQCPRAKPQTWKKSCGAQSGKRVSQPADNDVSSGYIQSFGQFLKKTVMILPSFYEHNGDKVVKLTSLRTL